MDTDDNWLNEAKVTLLPVGAKTQTDANGEFSLEFTLDAPLKAKQRKRGIATLKVERRGHITRQVRIASMDYFPRDLPQRTIAWIAFHPGFSGYLKFENTDQVPAMVMCGSIDKYFLSARQDEVVASLRKERNAAMNVMMEGGVGHGTADADSTWQFVVDFLQAAMRTRLNDDGTLKPVEISSGWLGATYDVEKGGRQQLEIAPYAKFKGDKSTASWLPDEEFAQKWQAYGAKQPQGKKQKSNRTKKAK